MFLTLNIQKQDWCHDETDESPVKKPLRKQTPQIWELRPKN